MVNPNGSWAWAKFQDFLPSPVLLAIAAMTPPSVLGSDSIGWGGDDHRVFMVKSAYCLCAGDAHRDESQLWKTVSKYCGLPRIRMFLWLVIKGKILTNSERVRRHMSNNSCCGLCGAMVEDLSHLFRGCVEARLLWSRVVKEEKLDEFLTLDFQAWLIANMLNQQSFSINAEDWDVAFGTYLWNIRFYCNFRIFSPDLITSEDIYHRRLQMIAEFGRTSSTLRLNQQSTPLLTSNVVRWEAPTARWIKVKTYGSRNIGTGLASYGGEVHVAFVRREGNAVADAISRLVLPDSLEYRRWLEVPLAVWDLVSADGNFEAPIRSHFPSQRAYDDPGGC
ncbi:hypothetical protein V6N11_029049 [Hibiscus sabdariffa]|uniref:Uncharacterized protein n=2 Tax=Hibiscus sabdariffa TaxID=183260 RepID=A0ABR2BSZ0_9ROSI